jgi:hypothetical protein
MELNMKKIIFMVGVLMAFSVNAEFKIDPATGRSYNTDGNGAWGTDGTRLNKAGNSGTYFGSDGGVYQQQGNQITQIGGFKSKHNDDNSNNEDN